MVDQPIENLRLLQSPLPDTVGVTGSLRVVIDDLDSQFVADVQVVTGVVDVGVPDEVHKRAGRQVGRNTSVSEVDFKSQEPAVFLDQLLNVDSFELLGETTKLADENGQI